MCGGSKSKSAPPPAPAQPTGPVVANYSNVDQRRQGVATSTRFAIADIAGHANGRRS
jgi:hypothetical protein